MSDSNKLWTDVDQYFAELFVGTDATLSEALAASSAAGLPDIAVAPNQGKLLHLLVRMNRAQRVLEIGTLGGYSTIWMARARCHQAGRPPSDASRQPRCKRFV